MMDSYPFNIPIVQSLSELEFVSDVTFLVGENGSGKSTLLEAVAVAANLPTIGSERVEYDSTLSAVRQLAKRLKLSWTRRTHRGFFMRSEDFFGFTKRMTQLQRELEADLQDIEEEFAGHSEAARSEARKPMLRSLADMQQRYGAGLDTRSHGESYFALFQNRFVPNGLYLMDEPEAPLSPMRQLALLSLLKLMVHEQQAQFIIATHSPILMAFPDATILNFEDGNIQAVAYEQVEHVTLTKAFLNKPEQFLRFL
jgi:predicted ATPase